MKKHFKTLKSKETTKQGREGKFIHYISLGLGGGQGSKRGRRGGLSSREKVLGWTKDKAVGQQDT